MTTRTITINLETGAWVSSDSAITARDGAIIASSVLPGTSPELVAQWYGTWMSNDKVRDTNGPMDTVGELITALQTFPEGTPITGHYDGTGRVTIVGSFVDDVLDCVAINGTTDQAWLAHNGYETDNPALPAHRAKNPFFRDETGGAR